MIGYNFKYTHVIGQNGELHAAREGGASQGPHRLRTLRQGKQTIHTFLCLFLKVLETLIRGTISYYQATSLCDQFFRNKLSNTKSWNFFRFLYTSLL